MLSRLIRYKVYIDRARAYVGYIQFIMMVLVMLKVYDDSKIGKWFFSRWWTFPAFIILLFVAFIVIGYLDRRFIRPREVSEINKVNPELMEIHEKVMKL